ncbi:MAG: alpha-amylase [Bacteroidota bacterium]
MDRNGTLMQYFHWYYPSDGSLWKKVKKEASELAETGITALWLPPAYKAASGTHDVGYGVYDMYDLGEFDQKGTVRTKYGTKDEFISAVNEAHKKGIQIYADVVFNHRGGADRTEIVRAVRVHYDNRNFAYGGEEWIEAWTNFHFEGRKGKYSDFEWTYRHFDGVDWAENIQDNSIFKFVGRGKDWEEMVANEFGNYDYLMFSDIDMNHPEVRTELTRWGKWMINETSIDGFRIDAVKHIQYSFFREWLAYMRRINPNIFAVGEYWDPNDVEKLHTYIYHTAGSMSLFDAPLHKNFHVASVSGSNYDMRRIKDRTLMQEQPALAVTLVENHDTQPLQALEAPVDWWFKPLAYAIILLREEGYPCVFYADYYGASYRDKGRDGNEYDIELVPVPKLKELITARKDFAYGQQHDFWDHPNTIGWTREGVEEIEGSGCAVLLTNGGAGHKWMYAGHRNAGKTYVDFLGHRSERVTINQDGWGEFFVEGGSVSVWVSEGT